MEKPLAKTLAKVLDVPFSIADATTLTEAGYVGEDVENIVLKLLQAADYDPKKAEKGIIYIDEIDKITRTTDNVSITRDVSGEGVQQALLKILEGTTCNVPPQGGRKHPQQEYVQIDTSHILFICGGTFSGLEKVISQRVGQKELGFGAKVVSKEDKEANRVLHQVTTEDLVRYGMIPEFLGRLPVISTLHELDKKALIKVLTEPKNSFVKQYTKFFDLEGVKLTITIEALEAIAEKALESKTERALRSGLEEIMLDQMYHIPTSADEIGECIIDADVVAGKKRTLLIKNQRIA